MNSLNFSILRARPGHMLVRMDNGCEVSIIWHADAYCDLPYSRRPAAIGPRYRKTRYIRRNALAHLLRTVNHKGPSGVEVMVRGFKKENISHMFSNDPNGTITSIGTADILDIMTRLERFTR